MSDYKIDDKIRKFRKENLEKLGKEELMMFLNEREWCYFKMFVEHMVRIQENVFRVHYMGVNVCLKSVDGIYG